MILCGIGLLTDHNLKQQYCRACGSSTACINEDGDIECALCGRILRENYARTLEQRWKGLMQHHD